MRRTRSIATVLVISLLATPLTACFGSFALTRAIYNFNQEISDNEVVQWLVFLLIGGVIPVYGIGIFIDVVVLNTLEFWLGSNPLASADAPTERTVALEGGALLHLKRLDAQRMSVTIETPDQVVTRVIAVQEDGMLVTDGFGDEVARLVEEEGGELTLLDYRQRRIEQITPDARRSAGQAYELAGIRGLTEWAIGTNGLAIAGR